MKLRRLAGLITSAILMTHVAASTQAMSIDLSQMAASPNPQLGLAFPGDDTKYYPLIATAGIGVVRLSVQWKLVEPRPGQFNWSGIDRRIAALQALGIDPFLTFESNADWATVAETRAVKNARPRDPDQWIRFVNAVVERYDGDGQNDLPGLRRPVRFWQAANEWISDRNKSGGWVGSTDELITYIRITHDTVKAADPKAIFVLGGIAAFNLDVYLVARGGYDFTVRQTWSKTSETVLSVPQMRSREIAQVIDGRVIPVLQKSPYDIADVHLYGPEDRDAARISAIRKLTNKPVLSAECGGPSLDYGGQYTPENHFLAVVDRNLGVLAAGGRFCLWFRLGEGSGSTYGNQYTALYKNNGTAKPGVFAYRMLSRLLDGGASAARVGSDLFEVRRGDGRIVQIGWNRGAQSVRAFAAKKGEDVFCLEDAGKGRLSSDPEGCAPDALILAGPNLFALLAP